MAFGYRFVNYIFGNLYRCLGFFLLVQFLIYLDRGIIPGAHSEFQQFLAHSKLCSESPEVFFGLLQGSFIAGLSLGSPILSYLATKYSSSIHLINVGLVVWLLSIAGCIVAGFAVSVPLLFVSRAISGAGEGAFVAIAPPMLLDALPDKSKGIFIGIFYGFMPIGTASGFVFSSVTSHMSGKLSWIGSYLVELGMFVPCVCILLRYSLSPTSWGRSPLKGLSLTSLSIDSCDDHMSTSARVVQVCHQSVTSDSQPKRLEDIETCDEETSETSKEKGNCQTPLRSNNSNTSSLAGGDLLSASVSRMAAVQREDISLASSSSRHYNCSSSAIMIQLDVMSTAHLPSTREIVEEDQTPLRNNPFPSCCILEDDKEVSRVSFVECSCRIIASPVFLCLLFANAAQSALSASLSTFGVALLLDLQIFGSEMQASGAMGAVVAVAGTSGTLIGGKVLSSLLSKECGELVMSELKEERTVDWEKQRITTKEPRFKAMGPWRLVENFETWGIRMERTRMILSGLIPYALISSMLLMAVPMVVGARYLFISVLVFGLVIAFITQGGINLAIMSSVPDEYRSMSISLMTLGLHAFGDVPGPILIGKLKDVLAPHCYGVYSTDCTSERSGLLITLFIILSWSNFIWISLVMAIVFINSKLRITTKPIEQQH